MSLPDTSIWRLSVTDTRQYIFEKNLSVTDRDSIWRLSVTDARQYNFEKNNVCRAGPDAGPGDRPGPASTQLRIDF